MSELNELLDKLNDDELTAFILYLRQILGEEL